MGVIFLFYRRADSPDMAHLIATWLTARFPGDTVFLDVGSIEPGSDFRAAIESALIQAGIVLIVIGPSWVRTQDGRQLLTDPADNVRFELEMALRHNKPIIPLLVQGATMPAAAQYRSHTAARAGRGGRRLKPRLEGVPPRSPPEADWGPTGRCVHRLASVVLCERYCAPADFPAHLSPASFLNALIIRPGAAFNQDMEAVARVKERHMPSGAHNQGGDCQATAAGVDGHQRDCPRRSGHCRAARRARRHRRGHRRPAQGHPSLKAGAITWPCAPIRLAVPTERSVRPRRSASCARRWPGRDTA